MTHRSLLVVCLTPFALASLACMQSETSVPTPPEPQARTEPQDDGFGALFEQDRAPAPRPSGDTAEPAEPPQVDSATEAEPVVEPAAEQDAAPTVDDEPDVQVAPSQSPPVVTEPEPATAGYKAIVAFYGGAEPEDFAGTVASLRSAASAHNIQVVLAPAGSDTVSVEGGRVNIGAFRAARDAGFVFAAQGRQSVFAHYPPETPIRTSAGSYFGVSL